MFNLANTSKEFTVRAIRLKTISLGQYTSQTKLEPHIRSEASSKSANVPFNPYPSN